MNLSTADHRNYWTEFGETWWSYRYMFLVGPKVFSFVVVVAEICRGQVHGPRKERRRRIRIIIIKITRYDYNLTIMKSPKLATDNSLKLVLKLCGKGGQSYILRGSNGVGVTIESYGKVEISYINVDNF
jgi:hypothetical protein